VTRAFDAQGQETNFYGIINNILEFPFAGAITNTGVVMRAFDAGQETSFYGIINNILEFPFAGNKELNVVFFYCDWFHNNL
jgi:hypothetical protein